MDVTERALRVQSRDDLVEFLADLSAEVRAGRTAADNASSADLLEGASGWVADMDGFFANRGEDVPALSWRLVAMIFAASLVYE